MSGNPPNNNNPFGNLQRLGNPFPFVVTPEQYQANGIYIQQLYQQLEGMNRRAFENYLGVEAALNQRIAEGERARQQLQSLHQNVNARAIAGPSQRAGNGPINIPNLGVNIPAYQTPHVGPPNSVNGNDVYSVNARNAHIANPNSFTTASNGQYNFRAQLPVSNNSATVSTGNIPQAIERQRGMSSTSTDIPQVQSAPSLHGNSRTAAPVSASYAQRQSHPNVPVNAVPGPSIAHVNNQQGRPNTHQPTSHQIPVVSTSPSVGTWQVASGTGPGREARYSSSSSSLAGALGEIPPVQSVSGAVPHTIINQQIRTNAEHISSHASATTTTGGAASTALASLSDDELKLAQREIESIARDQSRNTSIPLSKHAEVSTHPSSSFMSMHQGPDAPPNSLGVSASVPSSITSQVPVVRATQPSLRVATHPDESSSATTSKHIPQTNAQVSGSRPSGSDALATTFPTQQIEDIHNHGPCIQDYVSASITAQNVTSDTQARAHVAQEIPIPPETDTKRVSTPSPDKNRPPGPVTPASANKKTLAKDILRALNKVPEKRKASTPESTISDAELEPPPLKRQDIGPQQFDIPVMIADLFTTPSVLPAEMHADGTARIEEVEDSPTATKADKHEAGSPDTAKIEEVEDDFVFQETPSAARGGSFETRNPELVPLDATTAAIPTVPDSLPSYSAAESRASTVAEFDADTALQPKESPSVPLFLSSRESSPKPFTPKKKRSRKRTSATPAPVPSSSSLHAAPGHGRKRKMEVYVEVPILTDAKRELFYRKGDSESVPSTSRLVQEQAAVRDTTPRNPFVDEDRRRAAQEAAAIAGLRLRRRPCLWNDCGQVLNSANSLKVHVLEHAESTPDREKIFPCWWGECIRRFNKRAALAKHLQNHVGRCVTCAYQGCEAILGGPLEFLDHIEAKHPSGGSLKPSVQPVIPTLKPVPPLGTMFAYHVVNLPIRPSTITPERRARLGPWVARNCFGPVNMGALRYNARNQLLRQRTGEAEPKPLGDWHDRHDFLEPWPITHPHNCVNLESAKATEEIERGLVLLPDKAGPQGRLREQLLTSRADRVSVPPSEKYEVKPESNPDKELGSDVSEIKVEEVISPAVLQEHLSRSISEEPLDSYPDFLGLGDSPPTIMSPA